MKAVLIFILAACLFGIEAGAQKPCSSTNYRLERIMKDPALATKIEQFNQLSLTGRVDGVDDIIRIPVVIHNLYHYPYEKITDAQAATQIKALNDCFRRLSADTANTPSYFKPFAADVKIEFQLAISDPRRRSTTGIVRKYSPVVLWQGDDKMKYSTETGDDAWDPSGYLNIWVCNLDRVAGYASVPGDDPRKDGIVIDLNVFGTSNSSGYEMGKTAVHEVGHWLGLKHIWGDTYCGDDGIGDTPKQAGYNIGCPGVINVTCGNGPYGDMYMNYMDLTNDQCMNIFTLGQKNKMRASFLAGGPRNGILSSKGLSMPLIQEIPLPETDPKWLKPQLYPNPANAVMTLDLNYDPRWMGKNIYISNFSGQVVMNLTITSLSQTINISKLAAGPYILAAKKDDGESLKMKFVKL